MTEIAVVLTDGIRELDRFHSLLQPEHPIPFYIEQLTGISNEMVIHAPTFEEIADELVHWFEGHVFVAHNVGFDYSFVKAAFEAIGRSFNCQRLCTVRMSRKAFPGLPSYALGSLSKHFDIEHSEAHRALSDTLATVSLFHKIYHINDGQLVNEQLRRHSPEQWLPPSITSEEFEALPQRPGVYVFEGEGGQPLYIGKSANIKKRVRQHFSGKMRSSRRQDFLKKVQHISYTLTGNEWIAALLEDAQIRKHFPPYNKAQKRRTKKYTISTYEDRAGYLRLAVTPVLPGCATSPVFFSESAARDWLLKQARAHHIDLQLCGLTTGCSLQQSPEQSNAQVEQLFASVNHANGLTLMIDSGRTENEHGVIALVNGKLYGFGFIEKTERFDTPESCLDAMTELPESELTASILSVAQAAAKQVITIDMPEVV